MSVCNFKNVNNCFTTIIDELNEIMTYFEDESKKIPTDLSIKERRDYSNDLFDKMEVVDKYKAEFIQLTERFKTFFYSLHNINEDSDSEKINVDNNVTTNNTDVDNLNIKDFETNIKYANTNPYEVIFQGKRYMVGDWADVMVVICEAIINKSPQMMDKLVNSSVNILEGKQPIFSYDWKLIRLPRRRLSNGLYLKVGLDKDKSANICYKLIEQCGYKLEDFKIRFSTEDIKSDNPNQIDLGESNKINQSDDVPIDSVHEECFDDPEKLLKWLDKTN